MTIRASFAEETLPVPWLIMADTSNTFQNDSKRFTCLFLGGLAVLGNRVNVSPSSQTFVLNIELKMKGFRQDTGLVNETSSTTSTALTLCLRAPQGATHAPANAAVAAEETSFLQGAMAFGA